MSYELRHGISHCRAVIDNAPYVIVSTGPNSPVLGTHDGFGSPGSGRHPGGGLHARHGGEAFLDGPGGAPGVGGGGMPGGMPGAGAGGMGPGGQPGTPTTVHMQVPNRAVGAILGKGGSNARPENKRKKCMDV